MTVVYFIRHAQSDHTVRQDRIRPLTEKGLTDRRLVTEYLRNKNIDTVLSSPYKRAIDTVSDFSEMYNFKIEIIEDFREAEDNNMPLNEGNFPSIMERLWTDLTLKIADGEWKNRESIAEVQERNINAFNDVLTRHKNKNIVIGTHGVALSTIINYYDSSFGLREFMAMVYITPWAVKMTFDESSCIKIEKIDLT